MFCVTGYRDTGAPGLHDCNGTTYVCGPTTLDEAQMTDAIGRTR